LFIIYGTGVNKYKFNVATESIKRGAMKLLSNTTHGQTDPRSQVLFVAQDGAGVHLPANRPTNIEEIIHES
jgi:hypothetical protein